MSLGQTHSMSLDDYLREFGLANRPTLSVTYDDVARDSTFGAAAVLHGEASAYDVKSPFLRRTPTITWPDAYVKNAAVLFIDLDAPSRPKGPYVHSLWADCTGGALTSCATTLKKYLPPGNKAPLANRYSFLLFAQPPSPGLKSPPGRSTEGFGKFGKPFDLKKFIEDNELRLVSSNFMLVNGTGRHRRGRRLMSYNSLE